MPGYTDEQAASGSGAASRRADGCWENVMSDSPRSGSSASRRSTPACSSGGMPPKGSPACGRPGRAAAAHGRSAAAEHQGTPLGVDVVGRSSLGRPRRPPEAAWARTSEYSGVRSQQFGVGAVGHDPAAVEQHDAIGQADGGEPVGHDQGGPALHQHPQGRRGSAAPP